MQDSQRLTVTVPEAAELLGISKGLAYALAKRDELPIKVLRCGRRLLLSRRALVSLIEGDGNKAEAVPR